MKKLLLTLATPLLLAPLAHSQAVRWDSHALTINSSAPLPGALYPVLAITSATVSICTASPDGEGSIGAWLTAGTYQYNITTSYGSFGPFQFSVGAGASGTSTCGPLSTDSTSTNCGNGNFVSAGTTSNDQAYGYTNMGTLTHPTYSVALGNNSVINGSSNNSDIIGLGDFAANGINGSVDLI